jgi:uncharacterized protein (TIGR03118 family)
VFRLRTRSVVPTPSGEGRDADPVLRGPSIVARGGESPSARPIRSGTSGPPPAECKRRMKMSERFGPRRRRFLVAAFAAPAFVATIALSKTEQCTVELDLVADADGAAAHTDANLVNAWGVAFVPGGFAWVANNHSSTSTAYDGAGVALPTVVTIPGATGSGNPGAPTGVVYNATPDFVEGDGATAAPATLIFAGEDGVISAWKGALDGTTARLVADSSAGGAIYKGLAIANDGAANFLYATDFHNGKVDVFDKAFAPFTSPGGFQDKKIPKGYAPFGIQNVGGLLYVTYAQQDANKQDDTPGKSKGFVNCFDANGFLVRHFAQRAHLNAPWGMAQAPTDFGGFGKNLLVGNFGDGTISAFDIESAHFVGQVSKLTGKPVAIEGLWGIAFGNDAHVQPHQTLFFAAGPGDEAHGLYGRLDPGDCVRGGK